MNADPAESLLLQGFAVTGALVPGDQQLVTQGLGAAQGRSWLRVAELSSMRTVMEASFPDTVAVRRKTLAPNGQGSRSETWTAAGTYRCRLKKETALETVEGSRMIALTRWKLLLPLTADVQPNDQAEVRGESYEVSGLDRFQTEPLCLVVELRKVN